MKKTVLSVAESKDFLLFYIILLVIFTAHNIYLSFSAALLLCHLDVPFWDLVFSLLWP